jgi:hypothetical protein
MGHLPSAETCSKRNPRDGQNVNVHELCTTVRERKCFCNAVQHDDQL